MSKMRFFNIERKIKRLKPLTTSGKELESSHNRRFSIFSPFFLDFFSISSQTPQLLRASARTTQDSFTLIEVLISIALLAVATIGIFSVFPYSIRNITRAVNTTIGGSVARTAAVSLRQYTLDLSRLGDWTQGGFDARNRLVTFLDGRGLSSTKGFKIPEEIPQTGAPNAVKTVPYQIEEAAGDWQGTRRRWSAAFIPASGDGYALQLGVWHIDGGQLLAEKDELSLELLADGTVTVTAAPADFWTQIGRGDYVRNYDQGIWYRIDETDQGSASLKLAGRPIAPCSGPAEAADDMQLVSIYDTAVR
jgi:type II secretory pathway pseudopilin PulG